MKRPKFYTRAARGTAPVDDGTGALSVPIYQTASFAVSFGDALTLVQHPPGVTHGAFEAERAAGAGMTPGFLRISAGLEDTEDITADLAQALGKA